MIRVLAKDGSASLDPKKWIDVKVTLSTSGAFTKSFVVILDPISEHASMRYRKVDVDGSRDVRGKSVGALVDLRRE